MSMLSLPLAKQFDDRLQMVDADQLARLAGFRRRAARKITPSLFLKAWCVIGSQIARHSFGNCAIVIAALANTLVSKQGVAKRVSPAAVEFVRLALQQITARLALDQKELALLPWSNFPRVLLHDSTCISLPDRLAQRFPGSQNQHGKPTATLKIQTLYNLLSESFVRFRITPFTRNDQAASRDVLPCIQPGDLVIRDLGYFVLKTLRDIASKGAFFVSRLRLDTAVSRPGEANPLNLLKTLRKHKVVDLQVEIGAQEKLPVRLVAVPLPADVAAAKRRKARQDRDRRLSHSRTYLALLGWAIFITNVSPQTLDTRNVVQAYRLRWRIEIIFKSWKSHARITQIPNGSADHIELFIYSRLICVTLFQVWFFRPLHLLANKSHAPAISLLKAAAFFHQFFPAFLLAALMHSDTHFLLNLILYSCTYEKRRRLNHQQLFNSLG